MIQCTNTSLKPRGCQWLKTAVTVISVLALTAAVHVLELVPIVPISDNKRISDFFELFMSDLTVIAILLVIRRGWEYYKLKREEAIAVASGSIVDAIIEDRIEIVLQPVYRVSNGTIAGFESLVRMNHPKYGFIRPERMLPAIEDADSEVARHLTTFVINKTAEYYELLLREGYDFQMSINLHHHDLADAAVISAISNAMLVHNMPHDRLTVEISNAIISKNVGSALRVLAGIESAEVKLSLDDFGTETSPFLHFRDFLVDEVKIDNVITHRIDINQHNVEAVRAIVHTAHSTGTYVTAKCIETTRELAKVKELGCDFVQGYIIAPPMTLEQARVWLKTQRVV